MSATIRSLGALFLLLLAFGMCPNVNGQGWTSTATKAYPVQSLPNATFLGPVAAATPLHIVVGLKGQNADQVQPTLFYAHAPVIRFYGTSLTLQRFVAQFGATTAQVQAVQSYLAGYGFSNIAVSDNQLLIEADGTAAGVSSAFNTTLVNYSVGGRTIYVNAADAQIHVARRHRHCRSGIE